MKKCILTTLGISLMAIATAQNVSFGPLHGVSHSWMTGTDDLKFKPGIVVGHRMVYSFNEKWGVGFDLTASFLEGYKREATSNTDVSINSSYLRLPVKLYHFFGKLGDRVRPKIYVGPSVGYLLYANNRTVLEVNDDLKRITENRITSDLQRFDFGVVGGVGLNFRVLPKIWLNADIQYYNGLLNVYDAASYSANRNLTASLGVTFPCGTHKMKK